MNEYKTSLYTNITHEFRTPLTIILGMVQQIKSDPQKWYDQGLEMIQRNGSQLLNLVNQILDLSKLDKEKLQLKPQSPIPDPPALQQAPKHRFEPIRTPTP